MARMDCHAVINTAIRHVSNEVAAWHREATRHAVSGASIVKRRVTAQRHIALVLLVVGCRSAGPAPALAPLPDGPLTGTVCRVTPEITASPTVVLRDARRAAAALRARIVTDDSVNARLVIVGEPAPLAGPPPGTAGVLHVELRVIDGEDSAQARRLVVSPGVSNWTAAQTRAEGDRLATLSTAFALRLLRAMPAAPVVKSLCYGDAVR